MLIVPSTSVSHVERLALDQASERRGLAISRARQACAALAGMSVDARVIGSLASGRFEHSSDIDFLIVECPRHLKYEIEGVVEDCLGGLPFDVIYLDEIPAHKLVRFTEEAVDARYLR